MEKRSNDENSLSDTIVKSDNLSNEEEEKFEIITSNIETNIANSEEEEEESMQTKSNKQSATPSSPSSSSSSDEEDEEEESDLELEPFANETNRQLYSKVKLINN